MTMRSEPAATAPDRRTFDCPWCGAIHVLPADWVGSLFTCIECRQETRLTDHNVSTRPPTEAPPPDTRPHHDRVFDCPWCGAIAGVSALHLGRSFTCAECHRVTKLTGVNTRVGHLFDAAPDAPHMPEGAGGRRLALLAGLAVAAVAAVAIFVATRPGGGGGEVASPATAADDHAAVPPGPEPTPPGPETTEPPPPEVVPDTPAPDPALVAAREAFAAAEAQAERTAAALAAAEAAIDGLAPDVKLAYDLAAPLGAVRAEVARQLATVGDPARATPAQARAFNASLRTFLAADAERQAVAAAWRDQAAAGQGPLGRPVPPAWADLNLFAPWVREALDALAARHQALLRGVPRDLPDRLQAAQAAHEEARRAVVRAREALQSAERR